MKKTKVYWCHAFSDRNPNQLMGTGPEPLIKALRKDFDFLDNKAMFRCDSMMKELKNAFVLRASYNLTLKRVEDAGFWVYEDGSPHPAISDHIVQFQELFGYTLVSELPNTELKIVPPFFHDTPFSRGVSGSLDVGRWVRPIGPTIIDKDGTTINIKRGDPSMYIYFNRDVELIQARETIELQSLVEKCLNVKNLQQNTPLRKLYDMFTSSGYHKMILDEMKRNVI